MVLCDGMRMTHTHPNVLRAALLSAIIAMGGLGFNTPSFAAEEAVGEVNPRDVELPAFVMPISVDGKLVNFLFVTLKVMVAPKVDPWAIRGKAHIARDALIRAVHATPMTDPNNLKDFDRRKIQTILKPALDRAFGAGSIQSVRVIQLDSLKQTVRVPGVKKPLAPGASTL